MKATPASAVALAPPPNSRVQTRSVVPSAQHVAVGIVLILCVEPLISSFSWESRCLVPLKGSPYLHRPAVTSAVELRVFPLFLSA